MFRPLPTTIPAGAHDPRRVVAVCRAPWGGRRHYRVAVAAVTPAGLFELYDAGVDLWRTGQNKPNAIAAARAYAEAQGLLWFKGVYVEQPADVAGRPVRALVQDAPAAAPPLAMEA